MWIVTANRHMDNPSGACNPQNYLGVWNQWLTQLIYKPDYL
jgi:hypothetical protein